MELLFQTTKLIEWGGIIIILIMIFAETGLLLGLVVPGGETLIFTSGILISAGVLDIHVVVFFIMLIITATMGDCTGYYIGSKYGRRLYNKKDTWYFKKEYLLMTENYISKHKKTSIIIGKFFPVIRPFTPLISGISNLKYPIFFSLTILSVMLYMGIFLFTGYFLGNKFPGIKNYLGWILPISIVVLVIPVIIQVRKNKRKKSSRIK